MGRMLNRNELLFPFCKDKIGNSLRGHNYVVNGHYIMIQFTPHKWKKSKTSFIYTNVIKAHFTFSLMVVISANNTV